MDSTSSDQENVLGEPLTACSFDPATGIFRNGCCETHVLDHGLHTVCAVMTDAFLAYTRGQGNDLTTPRPEHQFPGLKPGDRWCLCASRWREAYEAGCAPQVVLSATNAQALRVVTMEMLRSHAAPEPTRRPDRLH